MRFNEWSFHQIPMDDRWRQMEQTLQHFTFSRTLQGFRAQLPPRDGTYPHCLYQLWPDGLFEFGTLFEGVFPEEPRSIPSHAMAQYGHDALLLFARIYQLAGYECRIVATARLDGIVDSALGVNPAHVWRQHPIANESISAQPWVGTVAELEKMGAASIARDLTTRVFLAAGAGPPYFFDQSGQYTG